MITLAAPTFDVLGYVQIKPIPGNTPGQQPRRISRVATLDGGVVVNDRGFAEGDRTLVYRYKPTSRDQDDRVSRLLRTHGRIVLCSKDGVFDAYLQNFEPNPAENRITILLVSRLSEE